MSSDEIIRKIKKLEAENTRLLGIAKALDHRTRTKIQTFREQLALAEARLSAIERELGGIPPNEEEEVYHD
jgi:hypothetical protein